MIEMDQETEHDIKEGEGVGWRKVWDIGGGGVKLRIARFVVWWFLGKV